MKIISFLKKIIESLCKSSCTNKIFKKIESQCISSCTIEKFIVHMKKKRKKKFMDLPTVSLSLLMWM